MCEACTGRRVACVLPDLADMQPEAGEIRQIRVSIVAPPDNVSTEVSGWLAAAAAAA